MHFKFQLSQSKFFGSTHIDWNIFEILILHLGCAPERDINSFIKENEQKRRRRGEERGLPMPFTGSRRTKSEREKRKDATVARVTLYKSFNFVPSKSGCRNHYSEGNRCCLLFLFSFPLLSARIL